MSLHGQSQVSVRWGRWTDERGRDCRLESVSMKEPANDGLPRPHQVVGGQAGFASFLYGQQAVKAPHDKSGQQDDKRENAQQQKHNN